MLNANTNPGDDPSKCIFDVDHSTAQANVAVIEYQVQQA
jgi:hypothetical protein